MNDNLSSLTRDLEHAIQVIVALKMCAQGRDVEPPASVFEAANKAIDTLGAWRDAIRARYSH